MPYVVQDYYYGPFQGEAIDPVDFPRLLNRAEELVEEMCMYRIRPELMASFSPDTQDRIRKAICAQMEYMDANGGSDMDNGTDLQSAGLGKFSYTKATGASGSTQQSLYAPRAQRLLAPTGLMYRGGGYYAPNT